MKYKRISKKRHDEIFVGIPRYGNKCWEKLKDCHCSQITRKFLIEQINRAVDENQFIGAEQIADQILKALKGGGGNEQKTNQRRSID